MVVVVVIIVMSESYCDYEGDWTLIIYNWCLVFGRLLFHTYQYKERYFSYIHKDGVSIWILLHPTYIFHWMWWYICYIWYKYFSGSFACNEISRVILSYMLLVLIRYIESGRNLSMVAETDLKWYKETFISLGEWLAATELKYPLWYRNLELGCNIKQMLLDIAKAVDYKYSVWMVL